VLGRTKFLGTWGKLSWENGTVNFSAYECTLKGANEVLQAFSILKTQRQAKRRGSMRPTAKKKQPEGAAASVVGGKGRKERIFEEGLEEPTRTKGKGFKISTLSL